MSNKPNLKRKPVDVLVNYKILKRFDAGPVDMEAVLKVVVQYVYNHPVYYHIEPIMFDGAVLFSLVGSPRDQETAKFRIGQAVAQHGCVLRFSVNLPVPKKESL